MMLTPEDGQGRLALMVRYQGQTIAVMAKIAMPKNGWVQLAVTLDGEKARLYGNGLLVGEGSVKATAHDFSGEHNFLASDLHHWFTGAMDDFRVWSTVLTAEQLQE